MIRIERSMRGLDKVDSEINDLKDKATKSDEVSKRMDKRLAALETEMAKSTTIRRRSDQLRDSLKETGRHSRFLSLRLRRRH